MKKPVNRQFAERERTKESCQWFPRSISINNFWRMGNDNKRCKQQAQKSKIVMTIRLAFPKWLARLCSIVSMPVDTKVTFLEVGDNI